MENQQQLANSSPKIKVPPNNLNGIHHDIRKDEQPHKIPSKQQKQENRLKKNYCGVEFTDSSNLEPNDLFNKELVVVIDNCFNNVMKNIMVNNTIHSKIRNLSNSTASSSNSNSATNVSATSTYGPNGSTMKSNLVTDSVNINFTVTSKTSKSSPSTLTPVPEVIII